MISRGYEETQYRLLSENAELRKGLEALQTELSLILEQRKEVLGTIGIISDNLQSEEQLIKIKQEIFKMPWEKVA